MARGDSAIVQGKAELEHWIDRAGKERTSKRIVANHVGPDLRFATVEIQKVSRIEPKTTEADEGYSDADEPF